MLGWTGHVDTFARDNLPPADQWPDIRLGGCDYPERLNAAVETNTKRMAEGDAPDRAGFAFLLAYIGHQRGDRADPQR